MAKKNLSNLKDQYKGRPAAVLGGGPSLPADMDKLPEGCVLIAVNYHAFHVCSPDFMVYNDHPESDPFLLDAVRNTKALRVSPDKTTDIVFDVPNVWTGFYSSNTAAWFALWLGCDPVILCGMDLYQGEVKYFHPLEHLPGPCNFPLDFHLRPWVEECRNSVPHPERLRAMSGPLTSVFGAYA